jgi:hypothetical protein
MIRIAVTVVLLLHSASVFAWNALGHKIVAEIAWRELDAVARQSIVDNLRRHPAINDFDTTPIDMNVATNVGSSCARITKNNATRGRVPKNGLFSVCRAH